MIRTIFNRPSAARRSWTLGVALAAGAALAVAGGGGSSSGTQASGYGAPAAKPAAGKAGAAGAASVAVAGSKLGRILVDGTGQTVYVFKADKRAASTLDGACVRDWPPLPTNGHARA